jgi:uncharacterized membrane protein
MLLPDFINGCFEGCGSLFILNHCWALYKHKLVRGVSVLSTAFFWAWGGWNLYYYNHLDQMFSWYAGMAIMAANTLWVLMMMYYIKQEKNGVQTAEAVI